MIALDTNILVRYFAGDDETQSPIARQYINHGLSAAIPGFVSLIVIVELIWVLQRVYKETDSIIGQILAGMLENPALIVERADLLALALETDKANIADIILHRLGKLHGCSKTVTFDTRFAQLAGVELLKG